MTRFHALLMAGVLVTALPSCLVADFDLDRQIDEQRVPGNAISGLLGDFLAAPIPMDVDVDSETSARGTGPATAARLSLLEFSITDTARGSGDADDFAFLERVQVFVESTSDGSSLRRTLVAEAEGETGATTLSFRLVPGVDLLAYVEEGARFASQASGSVPPDDVSFEGRYRVRIEIR